MDEKSYMKIIDLEQNTPEWLEWRKSHIGSSDSNIIMGVSPWDTPLGLAQKKLGLKKETETNYYMQRGHVLEIEARVLLNSVLDLNFKPLIAEHDEISYLSASFDGYDIDKNVAVEIKCPGLKDHDTAVKGNVPEKYKPQLQKQMYVSGLDWIYYCSYVNNDNYHLLKVVKDDIMIAQLIQKETEFWRCLQDLDFDSLGGDEYTFIDAHEFKHAEEMYCQIDDRINNLLEQKEYYKSIICKYALEKGCMGSLLKLKKIIQKGRIDYSEIEELKNVDLEKYRKDSSETWRITRNGI